MTCKGCPGEHQEVWDCENAFIQEMLEYWERTRGSGIPGTKAKLPDDVVERLRDYHRS